MLIYSTQSHNNVILFDDKAERAKGGEIETEQLKIPIITFQKNINKNNQHLITKILIVKNPLPLVCAL